MTYCSLSDLKAYLDISDANSDAQLLRAIAAASDWIDSYTGRSFVHTAADTEMLFYPEDDGSVSLPDLVTATSVKTDSHGDRTFATEFQDTEYELLPLDGPPYQTMRPWPTSSKSFGQGRLVQVIGTWGIQDGAGPPADVLQACLILSSRLAKRSEAPFGVLQTLDMGTATRLGKEDPDVVALLAHYRVVGSAWVAV